MLGLNGLAVVVALLGAELALQTGWFGLPYTSAGTLDRYEVTRRASTTRRAIFDQRTDVDLIDAARGRGERAFPAISPGFYFSAQSGSQVESNGEAVLPLGMVPHASNFYCNESGTFARFDTDRHGMRNPDHVWDEIGTDVFVIGDSFALGSCLDEPDSVAGTLRKAFPLTINGGQGGNGPLTSLATVREYAVPQKPKNVVWLFFENDLIDLNAERVNVILQRYFERGYRQRLIERGDELQPLIDRLAEKYFARLRSNPFVKPTIENPLLIPRVRGLVRANVKGAHSPKTSNVDLALFFRIIDRARSDIEEAGGRLIFVYMPDCNPATYGRDKWRSQLLEELRARELPVLDSDPVIKALNEPAYFYCPNSHFTPAGAKAVGDMIVKWIVDHPTPVSVRVEAGANPN